MSILFLNLFLFVAISFAIAYPFLGTSSISSVMTPQATDLMERKERSGKEFEHFIGSNLFDGDPKTCFSPEDVNVLAARMAFELVMMPSDMSPTVLDDKSVRVIMRYFCYGHLLIRRLKECSTSRVLKKAFFDAFGGFMHHYLLPVVRMSFYVGDVQMKTVLKVINYYEKCRFFLNTNGNGWRNPLYIPLESLNKELVQSPTYDKPACDVRSPNGDYCKELDLLLDNMDDDMDEHMIVALPKLEFVNNEGVLGNIWLPFSRKTIFSLRSCNSAFIIVGFYKKVSQCYRQKRISQVSFNIKFRQWIAENLLPHLNDEEFYPSLGGLIGLYKYLEKPHESNTVEDSKVRRRGTLTYNQLANKVRVPDECEMDWLREINPFLEGKNATGISKKGKKNKKQKDKKKNDEVKKQQEEEEEKKASKDDSKKNKKGSFKLKLRKWFGRSNVTSSNKTKSEETKTKKQKKQKKKKKSFFNWSWPSKSKEKKEKKKKKKKSLFNWSWSKWFDSPGLDWSLQWGWLKLLQKILKYGIPLIVAIIIFCVLCKLISIMAGVFCGVGGALGGDCFGVMLNLVLGFLKNVLQVLAVLFTCSFAAMCNWCGKVSTTSRPYRRDLEKPALPEIRIHSEPSTSRKRKKFNETELSEELKSKKPTPRIENAKKVDVEAEPGRSSRSRTKKRFRGGQCCMHSRTTTESSPSQSSQEKTSWQTFYDF